MCFFGGVKFNMEQRRREQEQHEKQQELQQLKHKDKSQQSEYIHSHKSNFTTILQVSLYNTFEDCEIYLTDLYITLFTHLPVREPIYCY